MDLELSRDEMGEGEMGGFSGSWSGDEDVDSRFEVEDGDVWWVT